MLMEKYILGVLAACQAARSILLTRMEPKIGLIAWAIQLLLPRHLERMGGSILDAVINGFALTALTGIKNILLLTIQLAAHHQWG